MRGLSVLFHAAVSLFVAPTPGFLILMYAHAGGPIPPAQGLIVLVASAAAYWAWLLNRDNREAHSRRVEMARHAPIAPPNPLGEEEEQRQGASRDVALRGHEDLLDPLAERTHRAPRKILTDRVADMRSIKSMVEDHKVPLLNGFHRTVLRDDFGAPDYQNWAYEADRFLMSSAYSARTLTRHEAIACLTAEVEHLAKKGRREGKPDWRDANSEAPVILPNPLTKGGVQLAAPVARDAGEAAPPVAARRPADDGSAPLDLTAFAVPATGANGDDEPISRRLARRMSEHRSRNFTESCSHVLRDHGWETQTTSSPGVDAIDVLAERGEVAVGLRCRADDGPVGEEVIHEVAEARDRFVGLDSVGIVAKHGFSRPARSAANAKSVTLLDLDDLADLHLFVAHRRKTVVPLFREAQGS